MKKWIIIKLTSLFLVLFLLVGIMIGLLDNGSSLNIETSSDYYGYSVPYNGAYEYVNDSYYTSSPDEPYIIGGGTIDSKSITDIYIDWINGNIDILETDDTAISINEDNLHTIATGINENNSDSYKLRYRIINNTLEIRYMEEHMPCSTSDSGKKLTINLPEKEKGKFKIKTNTVKSDILVRDVTIDELTATNQIGNLTVNSGKIYNLNYSANEGSVYTNCSSSSISVDVHRGAIDCTLDTSSKNVDLTLYDGNINVRLPKDISGYLAMLDFSQLHGTVGHSSEFENTAEESGYDYKDILRYGDESLYINAATGSGDFRILKK